MSGKCDVKCGFFVMQSCPNDAVNQCENCGKGACQPHLSPKSGYKNCVTCGSKVSESDLFSGYSDQSAEEDEYYNDYWIYSYRDQYYRQGYSPFKYSSQDFASFEQYTDDDTDFDDDYAGDFYDS